MLCNGGIDGGDDHNYTEYSDRKKLISLGLYILFISKQRGYTSTLNDN